MKKTMMATAGAVLALGIVAGGALPAMAADQVYYARSCGALYAGTFLAGAGSHTHTATGSSFRSYTFPSQGATQAFQTSWGGGFHSVSRQEVTAGGFYSYSYDYCG